MVATGLVATVADPYVAAAALVRGVHVLLSRFYLDFILILSKSHPDKIWTKQVSKEIWVNLGQNMDKIWIKLEKTLYPDFILILSRFHTDFI